MRRYRGELGLSVKDGCKMIGLSPSSYYYKPKVARVERDQEGCGASGQDRADPGGVSEGRIPDSACASAQGWDEGEREEGPPGHEELWASGESEEEIHQDYVFQAWAPDISEPCRRV